MSSWDPQSPTRTLDISVGKYPRIHLYPQPMGFPTDMPAGTHGLFVLVSCLSTRVLLLPILKGGIVVVGSGFVAVDDFKKSLSVKKDQLELLPGVEVVTIVVESVFVSKFGDVVQVAC